MILEANGMGYGDRNYGSASTQGPAVVAPKWRHGGPDGGATVMATPSTSLRACKP